MENSSVYRIKNVNGEYFYGYTNFLDEPTFGVFNETKVTTFTNKSLATNTLYNIQYIFEVDAEMEEIVL